MAVRRTNKELKMIFDLENGKTHNVALKDPKDNLTMTAVTDLGDTLVSKEFFLVGDSPITGLKDAYVQTVTIDELE